MDKTDALVKAIEDEALNLGCSGTEPAMFASELLDRILDGYRRLTAEPS